ncbi:hypothetical protein [Pseudomonas putida]|uniref:hypothetical protein n=1 Tax=Pseudomonas putida TaxID=303 RepID=UPI000E018A0A|nr:hypothetical protein [Pseudomonas putida]SUF22584.1 Uncharacterised protein [Pseudomonas putida]
MSKPDWSQKPQDFPIWVVPKPGFDSWPSDWHKDLGELFVDRHGRPWAKSGEGKQFEVFTDPMAGQILACRQLELCAKPIGLAESKAIITRGSRSRSSLTGQMMIGSHQWQFICRSVNRLRMSLKA